MKGKVYQEVLKEYKVQIKMRKFGCFLYFNLLLTY